MCLPVAILVRKPNSRWSWWGWEQLGFSSLGAGNRKDVVVFDGVERAAFLTGASLCQVFSAEQQSGQTFQRAEGGARTEQVFASQPSLASEQTEGGGESAKGNLRTEGPADLRAPGAAAGCHVLLRDATENQSPPSRDPAGDSGRTDQHRSGGFCQLLHRGHGQTFFQERPRQEGQMKTRMPHSRSGHAGVGQAHPSGLWLGMPSSPKLS